MLTKLHAHSPWLWPALGLGLLWFVLINHLRVEWEVNPQYAYGWAVPFLCAYLLWQRLGKAESRGQAAASTKATPASVLPFQLFSFQFSVFVLLAFLFLPIRLLQEANPQWRLTSWLLALDVVGLTLLALHFSFRISDCRLRISTLAFPICYFLVAVPWLGLVERPLIQGLTRANVAVSIELLNWFGLPAMQHGNTIEISAGVVGIDEACSGIRSLQATLMISLFLGELYRLSLARRTVLCLAGFALSFLFNLGRTLLLTVVAAQQGIDAIGRWHDPAGVSILVGCFAGLWALGTWLKARRPESEDQRSEVSGPVVITPVVRSPAVSGLIFPAFFLWLLLVLMGVEYWYRSHERGVIKAQPWTLHLPRDNPTLKETPLPEAQRRILRSDESTTAVWQEPGPVFWRAIYMVWKPGRVAAQLAQEHLPEVCLAASGKSVTVLRPVEWLQVRGLNLPFRVYEVADRGQRFHVFYCLWQDYSRQQGVDGQVASSWRGLAQNAWEGRRNLGQRSLEMVVWGLEDAKQAQAALQRQLERLIRVD